ncbi:hypothetical protein Q31b_46670 [Novipirellula aureliae]|uniref:TIGR04255 family protein n=1 Tax=Novipirellula aureliae TaxID=2527966 RepID=A0A5C6DM52_9BACT|nr:hypothetical protein [Novipirellula aureliae]TWU37878.1 hypothetical protein Q31b_46670 [Novipirellula aureliae]
MNGYGAFSDDFYINLILTTEMELPKGRESILHFFEQIRRRYPKLQNFYSRDKNEYVIEEEKDAGSYRWVSTESKRINTGNVNPSDADAVDDLNRTVLELIPYELSVSPLDCESLSVMFGFDFAYRGNHNEMIADVIGVAPGLQPFLKVPYGKVLSHEPAIQFALDEECRTQCRVSFESRTNAYQVRTSDFAEEQLSVYLTVRRYDSLGPNDTYVAEYDRLVALGRDLVEEYLVASILKPLQDAISLP